MDSLSFRCACRVRPSLNLSVNEDLVARLTRLTSSLCLLKSQPFYHAFPHSEPTGKVKYCAEGAGLDTHPAVVTVLVTAPVTDDTPGEGTSKEGQRMGDTSQSHDVLRFVGW